MSRIFSKKALLTFLGAGTVLTVGLCLSLFNVSAAASTDFTIVAIPDTQYYSSQSNGGNITTFQSQVNWIKNNASNLNIKLATHLGDIVDTGSNKTQLSRAQSAMDPLIGSSNTTVPFDILPGNHDGYNFLHIYSTSTLTNYYNKYFPLGSFSSKSWFGGSYPSGTMNNSYVNFSVGEMKFINISLGYNPDAAAKAWANSVLDSHSDYRAIISTHDYMSSSGISKVGQGIWNSVIKNHSNVFMVLCGHNTRENMIVTNDAEGKPVYQIMQDYQSDSKGGNGWLRYYKFVPAENKIYAYTYSPLLGKYETDSDSQFTIPYNMQ